MIDLSNKRILFLSPKFFGLEKGIVETLCERGAEVKYYDARCVSTAFGKIILKKAKPLLFKKAEKYVQKILDNERGQFDYVLIFSGDALSKKAVKMIRDAYPTSKMVLYLWDDVSSSTNVLSFFDIFDDVYSFDSRDCNDYGLKFRPLYYNNTIKTICREWDDKRKKYTYKIMFCGTIHTDRYGLTKALIEKCNAAGFRSFYYPFLPSKIMFFYYWITQKDFRQAKIDEFKYDPLPQNVLASITSDTEIVLDVTHPAQTGLTMRTIESIGLHKKLITTNEHILQYDFYNENNVCLIDRNNPIIPNEFWNSEYETLDSSVYEKYSIDAFIEEVLG